MFLKLLVGQEKVVITSLLLRRDYRQERRTSSKYILKSKVIHLYVKTGENYSINYFITCWLSINIIIRLEAFSSSVVYSRRRIPVQHSIHGAIPRLERIPHRSANKKSFDKLISRNRKAFSYRPASVANLIRYRCSITKDNFILYNVILMITFRNRNYVSFL